MPLRQGVVLALLLSAVSSLHARPAGSVPAPRLPDITVVTESGQRVPFHSLIDGRTVVINFVYTSCPAVCPLMGASLANVRSHLGKRDVQLISVSIDPETDTPARLAEWRKRFGTAGGWTLVTGAKSDIDQLLKAFGVFSSTAASHSPSAFVANTPHGIWRRIDGLAPPSTFLSVIDGVLTEASR